MKQRGAQPPTPPPALIVAGPTSGIGLGNPTGIEALRMGSEADTGAPVALAITGTAIPVDGG